MAHSAMGYLLGIDGGGTHTTACLADERLSILSRVQVGSSNPVKVGLTAAQRELARACRTAFRDAHVPPVELGALCVGLAGGGSGLIQKQMLAWLRRSIPARAHLVTTDAEIALTVALGESEGVIVIAGTGSVAFGRDQHGGILRVGGWGSLFDDAGSGYDIGRKAITCALRAYDGRGKCTTLAGAICREFGLDKITEVVAEPLATKNIAALFPLVQAEAQAGDAVARRLCREAACDLADVALTLIARLGLKRHPVQVVCSGGIFQSSSSIRRAFARWVHHQAPRARVSLLRRDPVEGALVLARQLAQTEAAKRRAE